MLCILFLYNEIGVSAFVGLAVLILSLPFNTVISVLMRKYQVRQMKFKDNRVKASRTKVARWLNLTPSFPWIAPGWRAWGRNPRKGRDQILQRSVAEP